MSFQILPDIQSLVRACLHSLKYNVLFLHLGQITFLHFYLIHQSLLELSFINIVSSSGYSQGYIKIYGAFFQRLHTIGQLVPFYKDRYNFYRSSQLMSSIMRPGIWLTMITTTTTRLNDWSGWHSCTPTTHQERPGSTNDLIWFGWVHLQNHHSVEWMVTPNFTKISSNLMIQNMFSFYSSCGNHSCLHFTANSMCNKTNVYIPRMYLSVVILSKEQTNIFNLDSSWIDVVLISKRVDKITDFELIKGLIQIFLASWQIANYMTWYGEDII